MSYSYLLLIPLIWVTIKDFNDYIIPNIAVLIALIIQITLNLSFEAYFIPIVLFASFSFLNYLYYQKKGSDAIGFGDIKWIFVLSIGLSALQVSLWIWFASIIALFFHLLKIHKTEKIPFGVYLSLSFLIFLFGYDKIILGWFDV